MLAVVGTPEGWHIEDYIAAHPGTGRGKALRTLVMPELRDRADADGIAIYTTAANECLGRSTRTSCRASSTSAAEDLAAG